MSDRAQAFLLEVIEVSRKHGLSISHEDGHGAFEVEDLDEYNLAWLLAAFDKSTPVDDR